MNVLEYVCAGKINLEERERSQNANEVRVGLHIYELVIRLEGVYIGLERDIVKQ